MRVDRAREGVRKFVRAVDIRKPIEVTPEQRERLAKPKKYIGEEISRKVGRFIRTGAEKVTEPIISQFRPSVQPFLRGARQTVLGMVPGPIPLQEEAIGRKLTEEEKLGALLPLGGMKGKITIPKNLKGFASKAVQSKGVKEFLESIGEEGASRIKKAFGGSPQQFFKEATRKIAPIIKPKVKTKIEAPAPAEPGFIRPAVEAPSRFAERVGPEFPVTRYPQKFGIPLGVAPEIKPKATYVPITNKALVDEANRLVESNYDDAVRLVMDSPRATPQTNTTAQVLVRRALAEGRATDAVDLVERISTQGSLEGQTVQSLSLWSRLTPEGMLSYAQKEFTKANQDASWITKILNRGKEAKLTPELTKEITERMNALAKLPEGPERAKAMADVIEKVADQIPLGFSDYLTAYRYQNALIGPRTQERNMFGNLWQALVVRPATLAVNGGIDFFAAPLTGRARQAYIRDVPIYYKNLINSLPNAVSSFAEVLSKKAPITKPDIRLIKTRRLPGVLTMAPRLMEGMDIFFRTLISSGEYAIQKSQGVADDVAQEAADKLAEYSLFRAGLDPKNKTGQGAILSGFDRATQAIQSLRKSVPLGDWFVMFLQTPMNISKQWLEYSPFGVSTMIGSTRKQEQFAKAALGTFVSVLGATAALKGQTTWAVPVDPKQKELFYASGRKPFSFKFGNQWIPMIYAGPFALSLALPAAMQYEASESKTNLTDDQLTKGVHITARMLEFFSQQTFMKGLGDWTRLAQGDMDYDIPKNMAWTASQLVPLRGLVAYVNTILDPIYRKPKGFAEAIMKDIPLLSQRLAPILEPTGEPAKRIPLNYFTPWDIGQVKGLFEEGYKERTQELQERTQLRAFVKRAQAGEAEELSVREWAEQAQREIDAEPGRRSEIIATYTERSGLRKVDIRKELLDIKKESRKPLQKLFRGMDTEEKAIAVFYKLETIKDEGERQEYLRQLRRQGVLTAEVRRMLRDLQEQPVEGEGSSNFLQNLIK